jgi:hypothetical protein
MRTETLSLLSLLLAYLAAAGAFGAGTARPLQDQPQATPLHGDWQIREGALGREGFYFGETHDAPAGRADFNALLNRASFLPPTSKGGSRFVPWGRFGYAFDPKQDILTLTTTSGERITYQLKYKEERRLDPTLSKLSVAVFYDPAHQRAFKLASNELFKTTAVFVPLEDLMTGSWILLPGLERRKGLLEFNLVQPPPAGATRVVISTDNMVEIKGDRPIPNFRLRQEDPNHWTILPLQSNAALGTLATERSLAGVLGPNLHLTKWKIGGQEMVAVLRSETKKPTAAVPAIEARAEQSFHLDALAAAVSKAE